ncbi:MAG: hypothetical protein ABL893_19490, partial [Hyphomicrobium sp.]
GTSKWSRFAEAQTPKCSAPGPGVTSADGLQRAGREDENRIRHRRTRGSNLEGGGVMGSAHSAMASL